MTRNERGFVLFEVIISLALFGFVATSMAVALNRMARTSYSARMESHMFRRMNSVMTEVLHLPGQSMGPGHIKFGVDGTRISVDVYVAQEKMVSSTGKELTDMYRVRVVGRLQGEEGTERIMERVVYSPPSTPTSGLTGPGT